LIEQNAEQRSKILIHASDVVSSCILWNFDGPKTLQTGKNVAQESFVELSEINRDSKILKDNKCLIVEIRSFAKSLNRYLMLGNGSSPKRSISFRARLI